MKQMHEPVSLAQIPGRIIQRRIENFQIFMFNVSQMFSNEEEMPEAQIDQVKQDDYGFDRTLVFMTKPNKVVAISAL